MSAVSDAAMEQRQPPFPEEATHVVVEFIPEVWSNKQAVASDDTETFVVPLDDALTPEGRLPLDRSAECEPLRNHENAPERAQVWPDIFSLELQSLVVVDGGERTVIENLDFIMG